MLAHRIGARPIVLRELLVHDRDARCIPGIGRQETAAAHHRYLDRLEVPFVNGVYVDVKLSRSRGI